MKNNNNGDKMKIIKRTDYTAVVQFKGKYYYVSDNHRETLIFPADSNGTVTEYMEVGGGSGLSLDEVLGEWSGYFWGFGSEEK